MNAHDRCLHLVAAGIDFDLSASEQAAVHDHLSTCRSCLRDAAAISTDAATIAALPEPTRRPVGAGFHPVRGSVRSGRPPALRLVAVAALIALLALGALAAGGEIIRRIDDATRLSLDPGPRPTLVTAERSLAPSASAAVFPSGLPASPPPCVAGPSVEQLVENGGGWGLACLGTRNVELVGYVPTGDGASVCAGWEPQWLTCPSGTFIAAWAGSDAPLLGYAENGDPPISRPSDGPDSVDGQPIGGHFARFTGHFGDPAAVECRAIRADAPLFNDPAALQRRCRETFVVTSLTLLVGADVPRPVVDATWRVLAGPTAFAAPPATVLRSIVDRGGKYFAIGTDDGQELSYLWVSVDLRTWQAIPVEGFALSGLAADETRLFGTGRTGPTAGVEVRTSVDGRTWTPVPGLPADAEVASVVATGQGVFAAGGIRNDAAIWRFDKDFWNHVDLPEASGIAGQQDAAPAFVRSMIHQDGLLSAFGDGPPPGGAGFGVARLWDSKDGVSWFASPLPDAESASARSGFIRSDGRVVIVGQRLDPLGPASWTNLSGSWTRGSFADAGAVPTETLTAVIEVSGTVIAIGLAPQRTDRLDVVLWGSSDGLNWSPLGPDEMAGGYVTDAVSTSGARTLAAGWQGGPVIWELVPNARP